MTDLKTTETLFPVAGFKCWTKGQVEKPTWLRRQNGNDFILLQFQQQLKDFQRYLMRNDQRMMVQPYNEITTGRDKNGNAMLMLLDVDASISPPDKKRVAIVVVTNDALAVQAFELAEKYCGWAGK